MPKYPPLMGLTEVANLYGVSRQLAKKWTVTSPDFPEPVVELAAGKVWDTDAILAWGKRHEREPGAGPRQAGDPRPPSVQKKKRSRARLVK
jgi:hypothetical protein